MTQTAMVLNQTAVRGINHLNSRTYQLKQKILSV